MKRQPADLLVPELVQGETIRWAGKPSLSSLLVDGAIPIINGFGFAFGTWQSQELMRAGSSNILSVIGRAVGVLLGLYVAHRPVIAACAAGLTAYAVTDRRIIVVSWMFRKRVLSVYPSAINMLEHKVYKDGSGSVIFRSDVANTLDAPGIQKSGFRGVQDVVGAIVAIDRLRLDPREP